MKKLSDKTRLIITIALCVIAAVAVTFTFLYIFGVFGGGNANKKYRVYALTESYTTSGSITKEKDGFTFTLTVDKNADEVTLTIDCSFSGDYGKVVSVKPYEIERSGYETKVTCGGEALSLKSSDCTGKRTVAVYSLGGKSGSVTLKDLVVTEIFK